MSEYNTQYRNSQVQDSMREGACSKDVWRIYNMLPENTNFSLQFYYVDDTRNALEDISFLKCGNPLEDCTVDDHICQMKDAFRKWGYSGYRQLLMQWNRGFGNSVLVQVVLYRPVEEVIN